MKDITNEFGSIYRPVSAMIIYSTDNDTDSYVEFFDIGKKGNLLNAHPLSTLEAEKLVKALQTKETEKETFLKSEGIIKNNILHLDQQKGRVIWFTKSGSKEMLFKESLEIPNGKANVPAMVWIADKKSLTVFALKNDTKPTKSTTLFDAPFFNIYEDGSVCMGNVDVDIQKTASMEEFTEAWENYFFNSYFSHLMQDHNPINGNCVMLWKELVDTDKPFPKKVLKPYYKTIKDFIL